LPLAVLEPALTTVATLFMTVPPRRRYWTKCRFGPIQITMSSKCDWSLTWSNGTTPR